MIGAVYKGTGVRGAGIAYVATGQAPACGPGWSRCRAVLASRLCIAERGGRGAWQQQDGKRSDLARWCPGRGSCGDRPAGAAAARPAHFGHGPLQFPLSLLHAGGQVPQGFPVPEEQRAAVLRGNPAAGADLCPDSACASCASPAASRCCVPNLADLVGDLSRIEGIDDVALTTNGVLLAQHAAALKAAGLARVTVSLDSLDEKIFVAMNGGRGSRDRVLEGIREAISAGLTPLEGQRRGHSRRQRRHRDGSRRALPRYRA